MIIKCTVKDNDFSGLILGFMRTLPISLYAFIGDGSNLSAEELNKERHDSNYFMKILNTNNDLEITDKDKAKIIERTKERFEIYLKTAGVDKRTYKYLTESLKIKLLKTVEDKWENGEAFYWMQHSGVVINQ